MKKIKFKLLLFLFFSFFCSGESEIKKIKVNNYNNNLFLSINLDIANQNTIRLAVKNGLILHFQYQFILKKDNWYSLINFTKINKSYYLRYNNITNEFILTDPITYEKVIEKTFSKIISKLSFLEKFPLINYSLINSNNLIGKTRFILNPDTLPTFLRIETIWSDEWDIDSDWVKWKVN